MKRGTSDLNLLSNMCSQKLQKTLFFKILMITIISQVLSLSIQPFEVKTFCLTLLSWFRRVHCFVTVFSVVELKRGLVKYSIIRHPSLFINFCCNFDERLVGWDWFQSNLVCAAETDTGWDYHKFIQERYNTPAMDTINMYLKAVRTHILTLNFNN